MLNNVEGSNNNEPIEVDWQSRNLLIPEDLGAFGVMSDEYARTIRFECPRYYKGEDVSGYAFRINYKNADEVEDIYRISDVEVGDYKLTFSWRLSRLATAAPGKIEFALCGIKMSGNKVSQEINSNIATLMVNQGLEVEQSADMIEKLDWLESIVTPMEQAEKERLAAEKERIKAEEERVKEAKETIDNLKWNFDGAARLSEIEQEVSTLNSTGVNLLRGTRDFAKGTVLTTGSRYIDGFDYDSTYWKVEKISNGQTSIKATNERYTCKSNVFSIKKNAIYTLAFKAKLDNALLKPPEGGFWMNTKQAGYIYFVKDSSASPIETIDLYYVSECNENTGWSTYIQTFSSNEDGYAYIDLACPMAGSCSFIELQVVEGEFDRLAWSSSPLDNLQNSDLPLPINKGGFGGSTKEEAQFNLLPTRFDEKCSDQTVLFSRYSGASDTNGMLATVKVSSVWEWIQGKIRSIFGFSANNVLTINNGGTGSSSSTSARQNLGIQAGKIGARPSNGSSAYTNNVTFPKKFAQVPIVVVTPNQNPNNFYDLNTFVQNVTEEGFELRLIEVGGKTSGSTMGISIDTNWIAIEPTAQTNS